MNELTRQSVRRIAELARLTLTEDEVTRAQSELLKILTAFESLAKVPVPSELAGEARSALAIHGAEHATEALSRMRPDVAQNSLATRMLLAQSPDSDSVYIRVPSILDRST